jgi:hypothetical protein
VLQEKYLPDFHFSEKHGIEIKASPEKVASLIMELDASDSWIVRMLLKLRGIPRKTTRGMEGWKKMGFVMLEHQPNKEAILGLMGQFWKPTGNIQKFAAEDFASLHDERYVKATWNFEILPAGKSNVRLETETRIYCMHENVRKKFARYWFFIKPFSALIRLEMLRLIRKKAEAS